MLKEKIQASLQKAVDALKISVVTISIDYPIDAKHGDYSSNVALAAAKKAEKHPMELAEEIVKELTSKDSELFEKIAIAKPGFINFWIKEKEFLASIDLLKDNKVYIDADRGKFTGKKIVVEYTDPNPFKEFHIGHLYSNIVGESIARLLEASGATVWRADYFGDVGMHVAKSIWGLLKKFDEDSRTLEDLSTLKLEERIAYFGQSYSLGATAYEEDKAAKEDMKELNFLMFKSAQEVVLPKYHKKPEVDYDQFIKKGKYEYEQIKHMYKIGREWSLEYFESIYKRLGTKFDGYYPESLTGEYGYGMVQEGLEKGIFEKGEGGAIIFPGSKYGMHERVFINALGLPTYETKDFGNAIAKQVDFSYDQSIIVTGNEINDYFQVVIKALTLLQPQVGEKTMHIGHGMVRLPEGKMSSRTGKILKGEWLLAEAKKYAAKLSDFEEIAESVGVGAVKYALLKSSIGKNVEFNFEESISFDGNSGPYLQYTYARTQSVLAKTQKLNLNTRNLMEGINLQPEERDLLRLLSRFPEIVEEAAARYAPHVLATYLFDLSQAFNLFYQKLPILKAEDKTRNFRLHLTKRTGNVLGRGLYLLGIQAPEKM